MSAPRLTRPLVLEARRAVPDGAGGFTEAWVGAGHAAGPRCWPGAGRDVPGEEIDAVVGALPDHGAGGAVGRAVAPAARAAVPRRQRGCSASWR